VSSDAEPDDPELDPQGRSPGQDLAHDVDPTACSTALLLSRVDAGDRAAFDVLYARYLRRVLQIARVRIGPRLRQRLDSMDLVQTASREALEHAGQDRDASAAQPVRWISGAVQTKIRNKLSYYGAERRDLDREQAIDTHDPAGSRTDTPSALIEREERWTRLLHCMDRLPEREREVLVMKRFENLSWDEIAGELGLPLRTAQDLEVRAKAKVARWMSG